MPKIDVKIFPEIISNKEDNLDLFSDDANAALEVTSDQIFSKTFPVMKGRSYTLLVSLAINGEIVSQEKKIVNIEKWVRE